MTHTKTYDEEDVAGCFIESHDYENAIRESRAKYICPKCKKDITLELVLMQQVQTK